MKSALLKGPPGPCVPSQAARCHSGMGTVNWEPARSPGIRSCSPAAQVPSARPFQRPAYAKGITLAAWLSRLKAPLTFALRTELPALKNKLQATGRSCSCKGIIHVMERAFSTARAAQVPFLLAERRLRLLIAFPLPAVQVTSDKTNTPHSQVTAAAAAIIVPS